jgi:hypothetical protein
MELMLLIVAIVVGAADPVLWIAPIIAAFFSRGRWWLVPLVAVIWGGVLELALSQMLPGDTGVPMGYRLASALLNGFVVLGIATAIRKMRGSSPAVARDQNPTAPE